MSMASNQREQVRRLRTPFVPGRSSATRGGPPALHDTRRSQTTSDLDEIQASVRMILKNEPLIAKYSTEILLRLEH